MINVYNQSSLYHRLVNAGHKDPSPSYVITDRMVLLSLYVWRFIWKRQAFYMYNSWLEVSTCGVVPVPSRLV